MNKDILIIAAHPDDEAIGCAGTIHKYVQNGYNVELLVATDGESARSKKEQDKVDRKSALEKSANILGIKDIVQFDYPDNQLDTVPLLEIVKSIDAVIAKKRPEIIFTHYCNDLNIDHQIIHRATMTACRPQPKFCVREIYSYEIMSSTDWQLKNDSFFSPNTYVDISNQIEIKREVLNIYKREMRDYPHSRSIENIINNSKVRGATVGVDFAEAFIQNISLK